MLSNKGSSSFDNIGSLLTTLGLKLKVGESINKPISPYNIYCGIRITSVLNILIIKITLEKRNN